MNIYLELTGKFNTKKLRAIISSGQAVVLHRLACIFLNYHLFMGKSIKLWQDWKDYLTEKQREGTTATFITVKVPKNRG